jgi:Fic-DOC domain mobile mystery protein B
MKKFDYAEGATPLHDYSGLKLKWVRSIDDLNMVEAENISLAQKKYLSGKITNLSLWFNVSTLKEIHRSMFCNVWDWAGKFRRSITSIGIKPYLIQIELSKLCNDVNAWSNEKIALTPLEQAARIHHRLVFIHPFENGNGRFARLVGDRYLVAIGGAHPNWPHLQNSNKIRQAYIQSLKDADLGDYNALIEFMKKFGALPKK